MRTDQTLLDGLIKLFYVAMALALLTTLMGSPGWGFLFLVFGSCALGGIGETIGESLDLHG